MSNLINLFLLLSIAFVTAAGYITNAIWTFQQDTLGNIALGAIGIFTGVIGTIHGIYLWF